VQKIETKPRRGGPIPRLSRAMIVHEANVLLTELPLEEFTLAKLAKRLNATSMSIYTYFPNRGAILDAVGEHIFAMFEFPEINSRPWCEIISDWFLETHDLTKRYPVIFKIIFWDQRYSTSWLKRWWLPLARLLEDQGIQGCSLAYTMNWLTTSVFGLLSAYVRAEGSGNPARVEGAELLSVPDKALASDLWLVLAEDRTGALHFGFRNILGTLETLIAGSPA
jgi:AcrR family transcriptional regulator